ncbi:MAG: protein jag [Clostridiales Family XIII bacterium]|jgi:spoIIIJ-associated protein|nr:protein jag [Clostridiales Family XIII bacterium]
MKKNSRRHVPQPRRIELDYSEKWGKDVDEATRLALADLKISESEAIVTVLEQPTKGFLGIGAKLAKVRVEKKALSEWDARGDAEPAETPAQTNASAPAKESGADEDKPIIGKVRDLRKKKDENATASSGSGRSGGRSGRPGRSGSERSERSERGERGERGGRREHGRSGAGSERREPREEDKENKGESRSYWLSSGRGDRSNRSERPRRVVLNALEKGDAQADRPASVSTSNAVSSADETSFSFNERPEDLRPAAGDNAAAGFFKNLVEKMGLDVNIRAFENDECVYLEVDGPDSRTVIGKRGQTLDAIQYLTNLVMNKTRDTYIRVIVDVEGYRSRREKTLETLAVKLARKVERTGRNVRLEPMNPYERKVIHATLQSNGNISTRSEGEEPYRRVIIERK